MKLSDYFTSMDRLVSKQEESLARLTTMLDFLNGSREKTVQTIQTLEGKFTRLQQNRRETIGQIKAIERNIIIYQTNIQKIDEFVAQLDDEVVDLKQKYNSLFTGSLTDVIQFSDEKGEQEGATNNSPPEDSSSGGKGALVLMELKKRSLLSSLENVFKTYEEKITDSNHSKEELEERKSGIEEKLEVALGEKESFYSVESSYSAEMASVTALLKGELIKFKSIALFMKEIITRVRETSNVKKEARSLLE